MVRNATGEDGIMEEDEEDDEADGNPIAGDEGRKKQRRAIFKNNGGDRTLESVKNITLDSFDIQHEKDPLFKRTTQKFDEMRIGNLMTSTLSTTSSLLL